MIPKKYQQKPERKEPMKSMTKLPTGMAKAYDKGTTYSSTTFRINDVDESNYKADQEFSSKEDYRAATISTLENNLIDKNDVGKNTIDQSKKHG